jgi:hypothetical protein
MNLPEWCFIVAVRTTAAVRLTASWSALCCSAACDAHAARVRCTVLLLVGAPGAVCASSCVISDVRLGSIGGDSARLPLVGSICMLPIHESTPPASVPCNRPNRPFLPSLQGAGTNLLPSALGALPRGWGWVPAGRVRRAHVLVSRTQSPPWCRSAAL